MKPIPDELKDIPADVLGLLTAEVAKSYRALPVRLHGKRLVVAMATATDTRTLKAMQFATGRDVEALVVKQEALDAAIEYHYSGRPRPAAAAPAKPAPAPAAAPSSASAAPTPSMLFDLPADVFDELGIEFAPDPPARPARSAVSPAPAAASAAAPAARAVSAAPAASGPAPPPVQRPVAAIDVVEVDAARLEKPQPAALRMLSSDTARNYHALPIEVDDKTITVAFVASPDAKTTRAIQYATGRLVRVVLAPREALERAVLLHYPARAPKPVPGFGHAPLVDPKLMADRDPDLIALFSSDVARKYRVVPIEKMGRRLSVAMEDPNNLQIIQDLEFVCGHTLKALAADPEVLTAAIERYYPPATSVQADKILSGADMGMLDSVEVVDEDQGQMVHDLEDLAGDEAPAVKLSNLLIRDAVARGASDLHIEVYETDFRIRMRIDGILSEVSRPPTNMRQSLLSRIKVLAGMNIAETRMPQDGRAKLRMKSGGKPKPIDLRVSSIPTIWGEKIAVRILDPDRLTLDLTRLGFDGDSLDRFQKSIVKPYGMILVVGPSGCGKTNTLYSAMSAINNSEVNIVTAEDPIEFNIRGINQVQTREDIGYSFATALRSFLRQDPNIILVGEIRDYETAEIAVKASLTGHLVLSTLHTTDAPTTISRLINMGIEPYLIATSVLMISAQRLVRKICTECSVPDPRPESELLELGFTPDDLPIKPRKGQGCLKCGMRGSKGRTGVFEVLEFTEAVRELVLSGATPMEVKARAREQGMLSLRGSGLRKIKEGIVSIDEVTRETIR